MFTVNQKDIPAAGHKEIDVPGKAATCTEKGLTAGKWCEVCQMFTVNQKDIPALGHNFEDGACTNCDEPCEHDYAVEEEEPTCTETGLKTETCEICGDVKTTEIPASGHNFEDGACTNCEEPCEHDYAAEVEEPTCTETGLKTETCEICGDVKTTEIPAIGHNFVDGECTNCEADCDHDYQVTSEKKATCEETGLTTEECKCGEEKTTVIPAAGHKYVDGYCTVCKELDADYLFDRKITVKNGTASKTIATRNEVIYIDASDFIGGGKQFMYWEVESEGEVVFVSGGKTTDNASFIMPDADVTLTAVYETRAVLPMFMHSIIVVDSDYGTTSPTGIMLVMQGLSHKFTFTPDAGCEIVDVLINGESVGAVDSYRLTVNEFVNTVEAIYAPIVDGK